ncbi:hypothetical protein Hypma_001043 [Hypsizygus marmoreus]|uniref:Uncharacterized protein n=1 Tax=Hypsizygus marmoreus TaxID=39966 RepID=A0A369JDV7_HYPMA|nr:hypothetical protein Hypma_001043 [Hypsizygus marmoreus]
MTRKAKGPAILEDLERELKLTDLGYHRVACRENTDTDREQMSSELRTRTDVGIIQNARVRGGFKSALGFVKQFSTVRAWNRRKAEHKGFPS